MISAHNHTYSRRKNAVGAWNWQVYDLSQLHNSHTLWIQITSHASTATTMLVSVEFTFNSVSSYFELYSNRSCACWKYVQMKYWQELLADFFQQCSSKLRLLYTFILQYPDTNQKKIRNSTFSRLILGRKLSIFCVYFL